MVKAFGWGTTIAMSWLWGLGFFFSIHFAYSYGWHGLLAFAIPNALGLALFGLGLSRLGKTADLESWLDTKLKSSSILFFAYQVIAIALTLFAVMKYFFAEVGMDVPVVWTLALLSLAVLFAEIAGLSGLVRLHFTYFLIFVALGLSLLFASPTLEAAAPAAPFDLVFGGTVIALTVGLLFGPWLDLQQWQRAIAVQKEGRNIARDFVVGALCFFVLLLLVGGLTIAIVPSSSQAPVSPLDGLPHAGGLLTSAMQGWTSSWPLVGFAVLVGIAMMSTLESGHLAIRKQLEFLDRTS